MPISIGGGEGAIDPPPALPGGWPRAEARPEGRGEAPRSKGQPDGRSWRAAEGGVGRVPGEPPGVAEGGG